MIELVLAAALPVAVIAGALWRSLFWGLGRRIANIDKLREQIVDAHIEGFWEGVAFADDKRTTAGCTSTTGGKCLFTMTAVEENES